MTSATELERLVVRMVADVDKYVTDINKAENVTLTAGKKIEAGLRRATKATDLYIDANGRLRNGMHQFASSAEKAEAAALGLIPAVTKGTAALERMAKAGRKMQDIGRDMRAMGRSLNTYVTLPLLAMGGASVKSFASFDQAMTQSTAIMGVTVQMTEKMSDAAMRLGTSGTTLQGPTRLAESYFYLASAGLDAEQSMASLPIVASFATAGMFNMSTATDLLTDAQSALGLTVKDATQNMQNMARVSDVLVKANTLANATVEQFSIALTSKAGSALKAMNKDVEEGVAVLAAYADQGVKAELAGNALDRVLRLLAKSSIDNAAVHKKLGFAVFDAAGRMRNMADIIGNLETVLQGMSTQQKVTTLDMLGFEARVQQVILPLIGVSDQVRRYESELRRAGDTTQTVADKQLTSFTSQLKVTWNMLQGVAIGIGRMLAPSIAWMNEQLRATIGWWNSLSPPVQKTILVISGVAAAIGPMLLAFGSVVLVGGKVITIMALATKTIGAIGAVALTSTAGIVALQTALGVGLAIAFYRIDPEIQQFNRELERSRGLALDWSNGTRTAFREIAEEAEKLSGSTKIDFLEKEAKRMENELSGARAQVKLQERAVKELNTEWNRGVGSKVLKQAQNELEEARARVREYQAGVDQLNASLKTSKVELSITASIDSSQVQASAQQAGFDFASMFSKGIKIGKDMLTPFMDEYNKTMMEAKRVTESVMTAEEKHAQKLQDLKKMLDIGAISQQTFERATAKANAELERMNETDVSVNFRTAGLDSIEAGTKQAALAVNRFQVSRGPVNDPGVVPAPVDASPEAIGRVIVDANKTRDDKRSAHERRVELLLAEIKSQGDNPPAPIFISGANL